jgi:hypothetical protein
MGTLCSGGDEPRMYRDANWYDRYVPKQSKGVKRKIEKAAQKKKQKSWSKKTGENGDIPREP